MSNTKDGIPLGGMNGKKLPKEQYKGIDQNGQLWLIYENLKDLQRYMKGLPYEGDTPQEEKKDPNQPDKPEDKNKKSNCCDCEEIRKIIQEEIKKIPKTNPNPSPSPSDNKKDSGGEKDAWKPMQPFMGINDRNDPQPWQTIDFDPYKGTDRETKPTPKKKEAEKPETSQK
ncbi:MAG: hypothetical protein [Grapevine pararetrovirus]|nr:MAG: hypothetical protein [Grapevine pararetrovirus]